MRPLPLRILGVLLCLPVHLYRLLIGSWKPAACRFEPTCSRYFLDAVARRGPFVGPLLALLRLGRCHPFGGSGWDPVPEKGWRYRPAPEAEGESGSTEAEVGSEAAPSRT